MATLRRPEVQEVLDAAEVQAEPPFPKAGGGKLIIRSISEKQRLRGGKVLPHTLGARMFRS